MADATSIHSASKASLASEEKKQVQHREVGPGVSHDEELAEALRNYVPGTDEEKRLVRKIDMALLPVLWIMYVLNYVDRTNIGNAKTAGMEADLDLYGQRYSWVISIFFFGYLLCEVPSNMILSRSRPSFFLPGIMIVWGALSAAMSAAKTYGAMLAFRFVVGCIESGFFPGVLYLMSCWYRSAELGKRFTIFYTASTISGAVGGLIAGAITDNLDGAHGIAGWRWLFLIEGVATCGWAIIAMFVIPDYPSTPSGQSIFKLSLRERQLASIRILKDGIDSGSGSGSGTTDAGRLTHWEAFVAAVSDHRTWFFLLLLVLDVGAGTISYFIPTITTVLGYSGATAQYMTVPIYIVAAVVANLAAISADHCHERRWHVTAFLALGFACSVACAALPSAPVARYAMVCFVAAGIWTALPLALTWISETMALPAEKRAIVLALVNAFGNLSSVYGSRIWPDSSAPDYEIGFAVTAGFLGGATVIALVIPFAFARIPVRLTRAETRLQGRMREAGVEGEMERRDV